LGGDFRLFDETTPLERARIAESVTDSFRVIAYDRYGTGRIGEAYRSLRGGESGSEMRSNPVHRVCMTTSLYG